MALVGVELETLVSEPDALTTRPPPCAPYVLLLLLIYTELRGAPKREAMNSLPRVTKRCWRHL